MKLTPVRIALILIVVGLVILFSQVGCATRGYVDRQIRMGGIDQQEYARDCMWAVYNCCEAEHDTTSNPLVRLRKRWRSLKEIQELEK